METRISPHNPAMRGGACTRNSRRSRMKTDYQEQRRRRVKEVAQRVSAGKSCVKMTRAGGAAACMSSEATELCGPAGAGDGICRLPRAYAWATFLTRLRRWAIWFTAIWIACRPTRIFWRGLKQSGGSRGVSKQLPFASFLFHPDFHVTGHFTMQAYGDVEFAQTFERLVELDLAPGDGGTLLFQCFCNIRRGDLTEQ